MAQAKPSQVRIPFAYITGLPPRAQQEIFRDFEEVTKAIVPASSLYDAVIDPGLSQSNAGTHQYKNITDFTVGEVAKLIPTHTTVVAVIGRPGTPVVETSNITLGGPVTFIGGGIAAGSPFNNSGRPTIDFSGHVITMSGTAWVTFDGIELQNNGSLVATLITGSAAFYDSMVTCTNAGAQTISLIASGLLYAHDSGFSGNSGHGALRTYCFDCDQEFPLAGTSMGGSSQYFVWDGGSMNTTAVSCGVTLACPYFIRTAADTFMGGGTSSNFLTFTLNSGSSGSLNIQSVSTFANLVIAALAGDCTVYGTFLGITVNGNTNKNSRTITGGLAAGGGADITGPCKIDLAVSNPAASSVVKLRGAGIRANIGLHAFISLTTPLQLIACTDSVVTMQFPPGVGAVPYTVDASSARCTLVLAGVTDGWAAGTNAGANVNIITELGSSVPSTAINPSLLMGELAAIQSGVNTLPAPTGSGGAPSGPAGGSLGGTYPNPNFAGRDSSVDAINKDLLPSALGGDPSGVSVVNSYPAGVGGVTVGDADYTATPFDRHIQYGTALTATRTVTLPFPNTVPKGTPITVSDFAAITGGFGIKIATPAFSFIKGTTSTRTINQKQGWMTLESDGNVNWNIVGFSDIQEVDMNQGFLLMGG